MGDGALVFFADVEADVVVVLVMADARQVVMVLLNCMVVAVPPCHPQEVTGNGSELPFLFEGGGGGFVV